MAIYPHLPKATVATTSASDYMGLLAGCEWASEGETNAVGAAS
jgi:hypothetical protein